MINKHHNTALLELINEPAKVPAGWACEQCKSTNVSIVDGLLGYEGLRCNEPGCDWEIDLNAQQ